MNNRSLRALLLASTLAAAGCGDDGQDKPPTQPPAEVATGIFAVDGLGSIRADATEDQQALFARGEEVALHRFTPEEGLGPRFNVTFCAACHEKPTFGGSAPRYRDFYLFGQDFGDGAFIPAPLGGVSHTYGLDPAPLRPGRDEMVNVIARRNPIPFFGTGPIAELPEESILANADPDDKDGDGISGRPNFDRGFVGRFGRKAQTVSIEGFIRGPLNNHLGITTDPLTIEQQNALPVPSGATEEDLAERNVPGGLRVAEQGQAAAPSEPLFDLDPVPDPELASEDLFALVAWSMLLGAPKPDDPTEQTQRGEAAFEEIGCAACHVPALEGPRGLVPLYSDLLLHDMGPEMSDGIPMGLADPTEFRTQPLWGIASVGPYLHDGRADTLDQAIRFHGGEGKASREKYEALDDSLRGDLIAFLKSLGGAEQESDGLLPPGAPIPEAGEPGAPSRALDAQEEATWLEGRQLFDHDMEVAQGLGPFFNGDSCRACHFDPVIGGSGPLDVNVVHHGTRNGDEFIVPDSGRTILPKLANPMMPRAEPAPQDNIFESRQTPTALGLGLIDAITEETILANEDPEDADGDGIRGVARRLPDGRIGRLGWKAGVPSTREFVRDALSNELGATVPMEAEFTFGFLSDDDGVADPEFSLADIDAMTFFLNHLAAPAPKADVPEGRAIFESIGCGACHRPTLDSPDGPVPLYSDLLLHDVAPEGYTGVGDGNVDQRLYRTPPLWGISDTAPYMHTGLAPTIEEAIRSHHAEGQASREAFEALPEADKAALMEFLENL